MDLTNESSQTSWSNFSRIKQLTRLRKKVTSGTNGKAGVHANVSADAAAKISPKNVKDEYSY